MGQTEHDRRVDYVEFAATDLTVTKAFYESVFGWKFTDYGPDYSSFNDGRLSGGFRTDIESMRGGALVVVYATDLEAMHASVVANGGTVVNEIFSFPGGRRFQFTDPSGNELGVWSDG
jgi:predicted enzyme related to lactoylglutathione lyase